jgi:hypothetical protein
VKEMKSRFSVSMLSSRQQSALPAPPAGPSTSTATYSTLVGKGMMSTAVIFVINLLFSLKEWK